MDISKDNNRDKNDNRLKSYSEAPSLSRLSDRDMEVASSITSGGDESIIDDDLDEPLLKKTRGGGMHGKGKDR